MERMLFATASLPIAVRQTGCDSRTRAARAPLTMAGSLLLPTVSSATWRDSNNSASIVQEMHASVSIWLTAMGMSFTVCETTSLTCLTQCAISSGVQARPTGRTLHPRWIDLSSHYLPCKRSVWHMHAPGGWGDQRFLVAELRTSLVGNFIGFRLAMYSARDAPRFLQEMHCRIVRPCACLLTPEVFPIRPLPVL